MVNINFKGKSIVRNYHLSVKYHQLVPVKEKSLTEKVSLNDNLIIHGDNLKALKALLPTYAGKIKCIYIDPPYNTGNEKWAYNDNVNSPMMKDWLGKVVDKDDLTRHDKWLCMMMPRLKLLRELLSEDGVIFISIDDNEAHRIRLLMDEIYGENNLIAQLIWKKKAGGGSDTKYFTTDHEYILVYAKNEEHQQRYFTSMSEEMKQQYKYKDDNFEKLGPYKRKNLHQTGIDTDRPNLVYNIEAPDSSIIKPPTIWRWSEDTFLKAKKEGKIDIIKNRNGEWQVFTKMYLYGDDGEEYKIKPRSILLNAGLTRDGNKELKELFNGKAMFDYPKPSTLIKYLIETITNKNSLILDSFAGSGTTAHAIINLNKNDGGNRKFILVECEDYADSITAERVRRVIKGVPNAKDEQLRKGLGGSVSYFELGNPIEMKSILEGDNLPDFEELARYVFYTATGEEFDSSKIDEETNFIGESRDYQVYLFYKPDLNYLKNTALTLERAKSLKPFSGKKRLVFAPAKFLDLNDSEFIEKHCLKGIEFCQLPFEIYRIKG